MNEDDEDDVPANLDELSKKLQISIKKMANQVVKEQENGLKKFISGTSKQKQTALKSILGDKVLHITLSLIGLRKSPFRDNEFEVDKIPKRIEQIVESSLEPLIQEALQKCLAKPEIKDKIAKNVESTFIRAMEYQVHRKMEEAAKEVAIEQAVLLQDKFSRLLKDDIENVFASATSLWELADEYRNEKEGK